MVFVFLARNVLEMKSQGIWAKFSYEDYRVNKRLFSRYLKKDKDIIERARRYQALPQRVSKKVKLKKKRTGYSSISENSPVKRRLKIGDSTTEEEGEEED